MLAKSLDKISVGDIVRVLEGPESISDCTESDSLCGSCALAGECLTQYIWAETGKVMFEKLDSFTIDQWVQKSDQTVKIDRSNLNL